MVNKTTLDSTSTSTSSSSSSSSSGGSSSPSCSATHDDPLSGSGSSSTNARSTPRPVPFTGSPGVAAHSSGQSPVDFFLQLIDDDILQMIHRETVRYLEQYMEDNKEYLDEHPKARVHELSRHPITLEDIKAFVAILIGMGICGFPSIR